MVTLRFFPIGNADCGLIDLAATDRKVLVDFAHCVGGEEEEDCRADLASLVREQLDAADRDYLDVVVFTHADKDHVRGAADFFYFEHAAAYQSDERIKIKEMWIPAALLLEENLTDDARVIRQEARHRFRIGTGIKVFSRPEHLKEWCQLEGIDIETRRNIVIDAGNLVPGLSQEQDEAEFFVHAPFAHRDGDVLQDRNDGCVFLHVSFKVGGKITNLLLGADTGWDVLSEIVQITKHHGREDRLKWDVFKIPHHCSYLSLSAEKGREKTAPTPDVKWLCEQGAARSLIISPSMPITNEDTLQPPHFQAANYYKERATELGGEFIVTMSHPSTAKPEPVVIVIDGYGATFKKTIFSAGATLASKPAPRAG